MKALIASFICLVVFFLCFLQYRYSFKINPALEVVYVSISDFRESLLEYKNVILIREQLVDPKETVMQLLKYRYISCKEVKDKNKTSALHTLVYAKEVSALVDIVHESGATVSIAIKPDQALVVPISYTIKSPESHTNLIMYEFHDITTFISSLF